MYTSIIHILVDPRISITLVLVKSRVYIYIIEHQILKPLVSFCKPTLNHRVLLNLRFINFKPV